MLKIVTLVTLLSRIPNSVSTLRTCTPNSQFLVNGQLCFCDSRGLYNEVHCKTISRRQSCQPGQIIWQGCNQCICQENGYLLCSNSHCPEDSVKTPLLRQGLSVFGLNCTPFRTYYVNCSICVCPASGIATEAQCVNDISCDTQDSGTNIGSATKPNCIPNITYLSPCMQCLCSEQGSYDPKNCADICGSAKTYSFTRCIPGKLFRLGCNVCRCPYNSIPDQRFCINSTCDQQSKPSLPSSRSNNKGCIPHSFTTPRCMYCDCNAAGIVNENICLELDCAKTKELSKHHTAKDTCNPGEMVPICMQCFCSREGQTVAKYCSRICTHQSKLNILESILNDNNSKINLIEHSKIERIKEDSGCTPNLLYIDNGLYCLCPENGDPKLKFCTSIAVKQNYENGEVLINKIEVDFNAPCEPNTFVQFDCNTCYCSKNGIIDPKWCTYDDCDAKRLILETHKSHIPAIVVDKLSGTCHPGSISKLDCNFCICPESGVLREKACTQNDCTEIDNSMYDEKLTCEPLAYYEVDCNICYCPRDGIKNVAKCTKNQCPKNILRSDSCIPGQLFCDECNVCVCPPDGNKMGKACTNHTCRTAPSWELLKLSHSLTGSHVQINRTKSLDQCFPGEEFVEGCKLCICPELGLKMYATCESILCEDDTRSLNNASDLLSTESINKTKHHNRGSLRPKRSSADCFSYNVSHSAEREECTPGTFYIIRCKQCICPYFGNINNFCRPLPKNMFCETAFPYFNYLPMGRRNMKVNSTKANGTTTPEETKTKTPNRNNIEIKVKHEHTKYNCEKPGTIIDKCFICDCEESLIVIEEHCFRSDAPNCTDAKPSFLIDNKVDL